MGHTNDVVFFADIPVLRFTKSKKVFFWIDVRLSAIAYILLNYGTTIFDDDYFSVDFIWFWGFGQIFKPFN